MSTNGGERCSECYYEGEMEILYKMGWVAYSWVVFMFLATLLFVWVPFIVKSFQEKQLICPECGYQVNIQKPTCLWLFKSIITMIQSNKN